MIRNLGFLKRLKPLNSFVCQSLRNYSDDAPFNKILVANRGEIAIRIFRGASELGVKTVGIYSEQDKFQLHRTKCDESYLVGEGNTPLDAYLNIDDIIRIALENDCEAVHPGYGFLSERADFSQAVLDAGLVFIGPEPETVHKMGNKTEAREIALSHGVPVVPGTDGPVETFEEAREFCAKSGYPVMLKASFGGGGRGMRVVDKEEDLKENLERAKSEAQAAFGNGDVFIEKFVVNPRHVEVQILGDAEGEVVHLFERDCSVQRRHQKVVETAPAPNLAEKVKENIIHDAVVLAKACGYKNAGTVEFLIDHEENHYFIEVNARLQVEHTVTEEITGVDLVHAQIKIASGQSLEDIGLTQDKIVAHGCAIQCRVTTEDPERQFTPDVGRVSTFRAGEGMGIRLDAGSGFAGAEISPHYDSLLAKVTGRGRTHEEAANKLYRSLSEFRIRGVKTNIPFLTNVLQHKDFLEGNVHTGFIEKCPELFEFPQKSKNRAEKLANYFAEVAVNGPVTILGTDLQPSRMVAKIPTDPNNKNSVTPGFRNILLQEGPEGFAKAVRENEGLMVCDTTPRDAHQSLLATRVRTYDLKRIAPFMNDACSPCYSLEMWGGATFDVALRFLRECPWDRVAEFRELIPDVPFQMLLRGANAVGYAAYPDNVVYRFCKLAVEVGIDVFRIFDSLNYLPNMLLGMDAVREAGGVVEAAISYTGDVSSPDEVKYTLDYYLDLAEDLVEAGTHVLCIKDMAGVIKPKAGYMLVSALREAFPDTPIHIHSHDTSGACVAAMLECGRAGADVIDCCVDSMSGMTGQPSMGAIAASLETDARATGMDLEDISKMSTFWEEARTNYAPFEPTLVMKSGNADVYNHQIPGGQYTNLIFQASCLNMFDKWPDIKKSYEEANDILGNLIKVTPSSKVVGDMAQFMVQNEINAENILEKAEELSFPESVIDFFQGKIGQPYQGYPSEELRQAVLKGKETFIGRPGAELPDFDFETCKADLEETFPGQEIREVDLLSAALYPQVFNDYLQHQEDYGKTTVMSTDLFFIGPELNTDFEVEIEHGKKLFFKMKCIGEMNDSGEREVFFEINGTPRSQFILDTTASKSMNINEKAVKGNKGSVGAPMPGELIGVEVKEGDVVEKGDPIVVLSAMKMETVVTAPVSGTIKRILGVVGQEYDGGDLLLEIEE